MQVTQCDKCGRITEDGASAKVREFKEQKVEREFDLCKDCCDRLMRFLEGDKEHE